MEPAEVNCTEMCKNGCILGDRCPNLGYRDQASQFIAETSLDQMLDIAEEALRRKMNEGPKWVFPEDGIQPGDQ